jgi:hypothetical protein
VSEWSDTQRRAIRGGLVVLAIPAAFVAFWALAAPRAFNDDFPGAGREWVHPFGAYNEHLIRDVGAWNLGLLAIAVFAFVTMDRRAVQAALLVFAVSGLPHLIQHLTETEPLSTLDNVLSLAALALPVVVPLVLFPMVRTPTKEVPR